ncbi:MAG: hypothetical protein CMP49_01860 [Flavobacteriales bacterium]|jgi:hypothetical protein|nr:hypothetical protein [Flavobacteriales bacterium]|tara:strand:- start:6794 stop:7672 length:879 start_codon:yes stop_codon:yes gene_type:complete
MQKTFIITSILLLSFINLKCSDNLNADIPSYIEIEEFNYNGNTNSTIPHDQTYNSVNITDAWVTMNGQIIGVFEIPCKIPILGDGIYNFNISPGIKANGIAGNRIKYPFYEIYQSEIEISNNLVSKIHPTTQYKTNTQIIYENEGGFEMIAEGSILEATTISDTVHVIQEDVVFQGNKSLAIYLDSTNTYFDIRTIDELELSQNTFLELNFKSNISFNIGIIITNDLDILQRYELIQLYASDDWKKIYLDLAPLISLGNNSSKYKIYFDGQYSNTEIENAVYIDNLKLVYNQ